MDPSLFARATVQSDFTTQARSVDRGAQAATGKCTVRQPSASGSTVGGASNPSRETRRSFSKNQAVRQATCPQCPFQGPVAIFHNTLTDATYIGFVVPGSSGTVFTIR